MKCDKSDKAHGEIAYQICGEATCRCLELNPFRVVLEHVNK